MSAAVAGLAGSGPARAGSRGCPGLHVASWVPAESGSPEGGPGLLPLLVVAALIAGSRCWALVAELAAVLRWLPATSLHSMYHHM